MQKARQADVAAGNRQPRLLNQRIAAIVERDGGDDAGAPSFLDQPLRLGGRHGQRLVRDDVLPFRQGRRRHLIVQVVWRGVVDDLDVGIVDQRLVAAVSAPCTERRRLVPARFVVAAGHRHDVDKPQPPDRVDVMRTDEAGANQPHADAFH